MREFAVAARSQARDTPSKRDGRRPKLPAARGLPVRGGAEKDAPTTGRAVAARSRFAGGAGKTGSYPTDDDLQQGRPSAMGRERARVSDLQACKQNKVRRGSEKGWFPALVLGQA